MSISLDLPKLEATSRYSVGQAAKALGVHRNTICKYCNSGILKYSYRVGKKKLIDGTELIRLWKENKTRVHGKQCDH